jgi:hypothetical protein
LEFPAAFSHKALAFSIQASENRGVNSKRTAGIVPYAGLSFATFETLKV